MAKSHLKLVPPATVNRTVQPVPPGRRPNAELRSREHLTEAEIERLIDAAESNRHGHRDTAMLLAVYAAGRDPQLDRAVQVLSDRIRG